MLTSNLLQHMLLLDFDVCISLMYQFKQYLGNVNKSERVTVHSIILLKYIFITTYSCVIIIALLLTTISIEPTLHLLHSVTLFSFFIFLAFDFCRFCVVIRFFHPRDKGQ